jgi:hypothetical protein
MLHRSGLPCRCPKRPCGPRLEQPSNQDSENPDECRNGISIPVGPLIHRCADGEHGEPEQKHRRISGGEPHAALTESIGDRECHEQHRGHGGEQGQLHHRGLVPEGVQDPRVLRPRPPNEEQDQQPADEAFDGRVGSKQRSHLRDREHEDKVEEEFERGDS